MVPHQLCMACKGCQVVPGIYSIWWLHQQCQGPIPYTMRQHRRHVPRLRKLAPARLRCRDDVGRAHGGMQRAAAASSAWKEG